MTLGWIQEAVDPREQPVKEISPLPVQRRQTAGDVPFQTLAGPGIRPLVDLHGTGWSKGKATPRELGKQAFCGIFRTSPPRR